MLRKLSIACLLVVSAVSARVVVKVAPPVPVIEAPIPAPGRGYVWTPGYYRWDGRMYVWVPGAWVVAPRPGVRWVPAHWMRHHGGWVFVEGHWR
jgi:WXXGXW repeat (2 copies)